MKYKMSTDYSGPGAPVWSAADNILLIPQRLPERIQEVFKPDVRATPFGRRVQRLVAMGSDKLSARLGWFTRTHPIELPKVGSYCLCTLMALISR